MVIVAEFTVEPFHPGAPGPHVLEAIRAAESAGAAVEVGPFGTSVSAETDELVLRAVDAATRSALANGATRIAVQIVRDDA